MAIGVRFTILRLRVGMISLSAYSLALLAGWSLFLGLRRTARCLLFQLVCLPLRFIGFCSFFRHADSFPQVLFPWLLLWISNCTTTNNSPSLTSKPVGLFGFPDVPPLIVPPRRTASPGEA